MPGTTPIPTDGTAAQMFRLEMKFDKFTEEFRNVVTSLSDRDNGQGREIDLLKQRFENHLTGLTRDTAAHVEWKAKDERLTEAHERRTAALETQVSNWRAVSAALFSLVGLVLAVMHFFK